MKKNKAKIRVLSCTLEELLNCNKKELPGIHIKGQLSIPEYQRPYVWKEKQIDQLLVDLNEYINDCSTNKSMYYLGSIILHKDGKKLNIIDGQQRITTMLLLNSFKDVPLKSSIEYKSPLSIENIKRNHSYFKYLEKNNAFNYIDFNDINITLVITDSEDMAYTFFETLNTGGIRLSGTDVIKAHHLRAIDKKEILKFQAKRWESFAFDDIEGTVEKLIKVRFWKNIKWKQYPFYRDEIGIKATVIDEFSKNTIPDNDDISYYHYIIKKERNREYQIQDSSYKDIRQPLYDGNNYIDFTIEYVELEKLLFKDNENYNIDKRFYQLRNSLLHGNNGTVFLRELIQITIVTYVSKFGFQRLYEVSLWLYRFIYSMRVSKKRNVREDSIFKFVKDKHLIDTILDCYTVEELIIYLKKFKPEFDIANIEPTQSKAKHFNSVKCYFNKFNFNNFTNIKKMAKNNLFDDVLVQAIEDTIDEK